MPRRKQIPIALTIAGSDSGGGAGIQADLKTFASLGVHGTSVITCITAQNPRKVLAVQPGSAKIVRQQLEAVFAEMPPAAVKTGMLFSAEIMRAVTRFLRAHRSVPLVIDPVMVSTSGSPLLQPAARKILCDELLPQAALVTPNAHEAEILTDRKVRRVEDLRMAAHRIHAEFGCAALVKGGHLRGTDQAMDIFFDGRQELVLSAPFVRGIRTHGTGCTYSAAIAAYLALGCSLAESVRKAKTYITRAIARSDLAAGHGVLGWL